MKSAGTGILFILLFFLDIATAKLFVSFQKQVKQEHDSIIVLCRDDEYGISVRWSKKSKRSSLGENTTPMVKQTSYGLQLIFSDIKKEDAGVYICKSPTESAEFELFVEPKNTIEPPTENPNTLPSDTNNFAPSSTPDPIIFVNTDEEVTGKEGMDIFIRCEARGSTYLNWTVNGEKPDGSKYVNLGDGLQIRNATLKDADNEYVCEAVNLASGAVKSKTVKLRVKHKPRVYFKQDFAYGYMGGQVELKCEVLADPPANITWYRKGKDKRNLTGKVVQRPYPGVSASVLQLILRQPEDFGDYKCVASNTEGVAQEFFTVLPGSKPNPPISVSLEGITDDSVTLKIEVPPPTEQENSTNMEPTGVLIEYSSDNETTQWEAMSFQLAKDKMYTIQNLTTNTTYQVRAATENLAGFSDFTDAVEFTTNSLACNVRSSAFLTIVFSVLAVLFSEYSSRRLI